MKLEFWCFNCDRNKSISSMGFSTRYTQLYPICKRCAEHYDTVAWLTDEKSHSRS